MKPFLLSCFLLCFLLINGFSQCYTKNDKIISAGIQFATLSGDETNYRLMPVNASFENIFVNKWAKNKLALGAGIEAGYFKYTHSGFKYQVANVSLFVTLHYSFTPRFEAFAGYKPGYNFDSYNDEMEDFSGYGGLNSDAFLGIKYFLTPGFGIYLRVLSGNFNTECGVSFKF